MRESSQQQRAATAPRFPLASAAASCARCCGPRPLPWCRAASLFHHRSPSSPLSRPPIAAAAASTAAAPSWQVSRTPFSLIRGALLAIAKASESRVAPRGRVKSLIDRHCERSSRRVGCRLAHQQHEPGMVGALLSPAEWAAGHGMPAAAGKPCRVKALEAARRWRHAGEKLNVRETPRHVWAVPAPQNECWVPAGPASAAGSGFTSQRGGF